MRRGRMLGVIAITAALAVGAAACGDDDDDGGDAADTPTAISIDLSEQSGSGLGGTVEFVAADEGTTRVTVTTTGDEASASRPAHVHLGTCSNLDPAPAFGLANVEGGTSETVIETSVADLQAGEFAVNLHASDDDLETYVACGNLG